MNIVTLASQELTKDLDFDESQADDAAIACKEAALEELGEWVDDVNNANDLNSIGGLRLLLLHLASRHAGIRWRSCEVPLQHPPTPALCHHLCNPSSSLVPTSPPPPYLRC